MKMAGEGVEIITLDSSENEEETTETPFEPPGKLLFKKFISTCSPLIADTKKRSAMVGLLQKRFNQAKEAFQESEEFANILTAHIDELSTKKKDAFKHILEIVNVLKSAASGDSKKKTKHKKGDNARTSNQEQAKREKKQNHISGSDSDKCKRAQSRDGTSGSERDSTAPESDSYTRLKEQQSEEASNKPSPQMNEQKEKTEDNQEKTAGDTDKTDVNTTGDNADQISSELSVLPIEQKDQQEQSGNADTNTENNSGLYQKNAETVKKPEKRKKKVTNRQIRKYERLLHKLSLEIKRLSEKELTLDEMDEEDSTHILEYQLRKRAMKVYEKLCELKEVQPNTGRVSERRIKFQGTRYPEINKKLEKLANLPEYFPDFQDVYIIITKVNDKKGLGLDRRRIYNIAKDSFEMIGKKLQQRRQEDFLANFSSHPTLDFVEAHDPAELDLELQMKLKTNYRFGSQKLDEVARCYEERQKTNEEMGVNMEVVSANSESEQSAGESDEAAPKKKKRRISLIKVVEDDEDDRGEEDGDSQTATEDDTADEGTGQSAQEADDEEDESDGDAKDEDEDDDGADDFGALSPLSTDEEVEPISDDGNSVEEVKSPQIDGEPEIEVKLPQNDGESEIGVKSPQKGGELEIEQPEIEQSENNAANTFPLDATSNDVSSTAEASSSVSDTNLSSTSTLDNVNHPMPQSVSLNNELNKSQEQITAGKPTCHVKTKQPSVPNGNHAIGHAEHVKGDTSTGPECPSNSATSAVQVVDSSSSLPIILNVMSLRHEGDKETDGSPPLTASDLGVTDREVRKRRIILPSKASSLSGTELQKLPVEDAPKDAPTTVPKARSPSPCSSPQVSSSRSPSRSRRQCITDSPEEITLLSSDSDSDILEVSDDENNVMAASVQKVPHVLLDSTEYRTERRVGPHVPLRRLSPDPSGPSLSGQRDTSTSSVQERRWQKSVRHTSTPREHWLGATVCSQHKHFGPLSRPKTRRRGEAELITLSDSD